MENNNREGRMSRGDREMTNALRHHLFLSASKDWNDYLGRLMDRRGHFKSDKEREAAVLSASTLCLGVLDCLTFAICDAEEEDLRVRLSAKFRENLRILISYREFSATNTQNGGNK